MDAKGARALVHRILNGPADGWREDHYGPEPENKKQRVMRCPECGRIASVAEWIGRPLCVHSWESGTPEIWDGDDPPIENAVNEAWRSPGPNTWTEMEPYNFADVVLELHATREALGQAIAEIEGSPYKTEPWGWGISHRMAGWKRILGRNRNA